MSGSSSTLVTLHGGRAFRKLARSPGPAQPGTAVPHEHGRSAAESSGNRRTSNLWPETRKEIMSLRPVKQVIQTKPTIEGAGVKLQRAFGFGKTKDFDPFLLLDDFRNDNPEDYLVGFPWHPHRGIETITYVLAGAVEHGDSLGNK